MALTGSEFNNEKGTQGGLLKWIWGKIYIYINAAVSAVDLSNFYSKSETDAAIGTAVADEAAARDSAIGTILYELANNYDTTNDVSIKINAAITGLVDGAPTALDTLKELAAALTLNGNADTSTLAALNALIVTVDGKASKASVDALTSAVSGKANVSDVNSVLTKVKAVMSLFAEKFALASQTIMVNFTDAPYFVSLVSGKYSFGGFGHVVEVNGIFNQNGLLLKGKKVTGDTSTFMAMFTADSTLDYIYEAPNSNIVNGDTTGQPIRVVFNPDLAILQSEASAFRMLVTERNPDAMLSTYGNAFDPEGKLTALQTASV